MSGRAGTILKNALIIAGALLCFLAVSLLLVSLTAANGMYPSGKEAMLHLYRGDLLYHEIGSGVFYPLLDRLWYNGLEMMRYQSPLPVYLLAFCQLIGGGSVFGAYLWAVGLICFFCGVEGLILGYRLKRPVIGSVLGLFWFFLPSNLYMLFVHGNLPGAFGLLLLPVFLFCYIAYMNRSGIRHLFFVWLSFFLILLTDLCMAGICALCMAVFLAFDMLMNRHYRRAVHGVIVMLLAFVTTGLWAYPAFRGGYFSSRMDFTPADLQGLLFMLDPFRRLFSGGNAFYLCLTGFLLGLFGLVLSHKKEMSAFLSGSLLILLIAFSLFPFGALSPRDPERGMTFAVSIALLFILAGFFLWRSLKWPFVLLWSCLLLLDFIPSFGAFIGTGGGLPAEERFAAMENETLIGRAKSITKRRLLFMDGGELGSVGPWLISGFGTRLETSGGADIASSEIATNLEQLEEAIGYGCYPYLFDRALALGNDSVLLKTSALGIEAGHWDEVDRAAWSLGYSLADYNDDYRLYHRETPPDFGVITNYSAIGIGRYTKNFSLFFPSMEETASDSLDDYTLDELSAYSFIYLSGFTYTDRERAEYLVRELAERGVRVVISGDGLPVDTHTGVRSFLGVSASPISFRNGYPDLITIDGVISPDYFAPGFEDWQTCYLNGLTEVWGSIEEQGEKLGFYGTAGNENIVFIGLNLTYHFALTGDKAVGRLIDRAYSITPGRLPVRKLIPLELRYEKDRILIRSGQDNVNTTLAWHDDFRNSSGVYAKNNLLHVTDGESVITMGYPFFWPGFFITLLGAFLTLAFFLLVYHLKKGVVILQVEALKVQLPAAGEKASDEVSVPPDCGYAVRFAHWQDARGKKLAKGMVFSEGEQTLVIGFRAKGAARFTSLTTGTVNGEEAKPVFAFDHEKELCLKKTWTAILPLGFRRQPESVSALAGTPVEVKWELTKPAKVGYLETLDAGRWVVCDMLPEQEDTAFSFTFRSFIVCRHQYRLSFLSDEEESITSDEFVVSFESDRVFDGFADLENERSASLPQWLAPADFFKESGPGQDNK